MARKKYWFNFDREWLKEKFMTREPALYNELYCAEFRGDIAHDYQIFEVPIGNARMNQKVKFCTEAPLIKYHQKRSNSYFLSSLASAFHCICDNRAFTTLVN